MIRRLSIAFVLALALVGCAGEPPRSGPIDAHTLADLARVRLDPAAFAAAINGYRASHGLGPLRPDPALTAMAERQADAMAKANALSHTIAGGFAARLAAAGVDATEAGENLGGGYYSINEAMAAWRGSPDHDANLLIEAATLYGVAIAKNPRTEYRVYWALEVASDPRNPVEAMLLQASPGGLLISPKP